MFINNIQKFLKRSSGFSLAEISIAIIILGVLASLALPRYSSFIERNKAAEGAQLLMVLLSAQLTEMQENGVYENDINNIDITIPPSNNFDTPVLIDSGVNVNGIASVERNNGDYELHVFETGVVECWNNAALCQKMGFATP